VFGPVQQHVQRASYDWQFEKNSMQAAAPSTRIACPSHYEQKTKSMIRRPLHQLEWRESEIALVDARVLTLLCVLLLREIASFVG
jgi:phage terminase small subunit